MGKDLEGGVYWLYEGTTVRAFTWRRWEGREISVRTLSDTVDIRTGCHTDKYRELCRCTPSTSWFCIPIGQGWTNYGTREHFLGTRHLLLFQIFLFLLFYQLLYMCVYVCIYTYTYTYTHTHTSNSVQTVYELPLLPNSTTVKHFYTNRDGAKCWLDIYHWGAGLAVTGRIRDFGQNVL